MNSELCGPPRQPKLGFDSNAGWFAYLMPHGQAFVKRYPEIADLTPWFCYSKIYQAPAYGLEPHNPRKNIPPRGSAAFAEDWYRLSHSLHAAAGTETQ